MTKNIRWAATGVISIRHNLAVHLRVYGVYYLAFACFLFTLAVYYPGYMSFDSIYQLGGAREGVTDNWNPPMMAYIWRVLDRIIPGPGGMLIVNTGLFWFALAAIAAAISSSNLMRAAILLFCGFLPPVFGLIGTIWKDVGMLSFFLAAVAFSLHARKRRSIWMLVCSTVFIWLGGSYRHNAFVATLPLILMNAAIAVPLLKARFSRQAAALADRGYERAWVAGGTAALCGIMAVTILMVNYYGVEDSQIWRPILIHDLVGMSVSQGVNLLPDAVSRKSHVTIEDLKKIYVGHNHATLSHPATRRMLGSLDPTSTVVIDSQGDGAAVFKTWLAAVLHHPGSYLRHRGQIADRLLVLKAGTPFYPFHTGIDANRFQITFEPSALNSRVMQWLQLASSTYFYSAWIYHLLLLAVIPMCLLFPFRHSLSMQAVAASGILYALTNLFMAGAADFRYNSWVIGACCVCISLGAGGFRSRQTKQACQPNQPVDAAGTQSPNGQGR
jgi:hypothetical protein